MLTQTYYLKRIYSPRGCTDTRDCIMNIHDCLYAIKQLDVADKTYNSISIRLHKLTERYSQLAKKEKISYDWQEALKRYRNEKNITSPYSLGNINNNNMVTITNYFEQTKGFDFSKITHPKKDAIRQGHDFMTENHDLYNDDPDIKTAIDNHIKLVNEAFKAKEEKPEPTPKTQPKVKSTSKPKTQPKAKPEKPVERAKAQAAPKPKQRKPKYKIGDVLNWRDNDGNHIREKIVSIDFKSDGEPIYTCTHSNNTFKYAESEIAENIKRKAMYLNQPAPQEVHQIEPERKFIKRYAQLHGKTKSPDELMPFLRSLQKAIADKTITKKSQLADEIMNIQKGLIKVINTGRVKIEIDEHNLSRYKSIANGEKLIVSVPLIKQFIALTGKESVKEQAKALRNRIYNAEQSGMLKGDPHQADVTAAKGILTAYIDGKTKTVQVPDISLRGLYGIVGEEMPITTFKPGKVVSSSDFVTASFVLLGFDGKWKKLIGNPQEPFKIMIYGGPGSGKSSLALQLSHYLAKNHNQKVLIVAKEEGFNYTLKEKLERLNISHPNLFIVDHLPNDLSAYKTVMLDSVNTLNISSEGVRAIYSKYPRTNFIQVFQTTKDGKFRGEKDYEHDVDSVLRTEAMVAYPEKNRFGGKDSVKIV